MPPCWIHLLALIVFMWTPTLFDPIDYTVHGIFQARMSPERVHLQCRKPSWATREAQEYWSGQPIPSPADLPNPGIEPGSPALLVDFSPTELPGKPQFEKIHAPLMFTAAPSAIVRTWKQPKCPLTDEWIKMWYVYIIHYYLAIIKEWNIAICSNTNEPRDYYGLLGWIRVKRIWLQCGRPGFNPWVGKIPWRWEWLPNPVFLPREFHGERSLGGYSPWGHKESDTEWLTLSLSSEIIILSDVNHRAKDKYHMLSLISGIYKIIETNLFIKL